MRGRDGLKAVVATDGVDQLLIGSRFGPQVGAANQRPKRKALA